MLLCLEGFIMALMSIGTTALLLYRSLTGKSSYRLVYGVVGAVISSWLLFLLYWFLSIIWAALATSNYNSRIDQETEAILNSENTSGDS
jgi:hypothetical protein